jgi:[ribosomal protein S5]-alanine N-acetyltransferase
MNSFDQVQLHTPRLLLRPLRSADADALLAIFSDPQVMRYWSTPPWTSSEQAQALISKDLQGMASGEHIRLGLQRLSDQTLIGHCCLFSLSQQSRRAEMGYGIARNCWGQGYMDEALRALLNWGFAQLDLNRVEADIDPRNLASERSLLRLGFVKEGHLRQRWIVGDEVSDTGLYGLLRSDWAAPGRSARG